MSLLDRYGRPIERPRERRAIGFVERTLGEDEPEALMNVTPPSAAGWGRWHGFPGRLDRDSFAHEAED